MSEVVTPAPAIGYSIIANLGDDRQMTVQCFVEQDEDVEVISAKVDKVLAIVDRQKARYSIKDLKKDLAKQEQTLAQAEEDLIRIEQQHEEAKRGWQDRMVSLANEIDEIDAAAAQRGRSAPAGADAARQRNLRAEGKEVKAALDKNEAERDQYRGNVLISIDRFRTAIAATTEQIAEMQALIDGA